MSTARGTGPEGQPVLLYDTTLRDGGQREGLTVSLTDTVSFKKS